MQMHPARRIAEAIGSWLHLEFCCYRAGLFSETALKAAVGQVLSAFPIVKDGARAYSDFPHDALNPVKKRGRKKEVDFALLLAAQNLPKRGAEIAIEAKWAGSSHCSPEQIYEDFLRLALIKRMDPACTCIFVLAGKHSTMEELTKSIPFVTTGKKNRGIGLKINHKKFEFDLPMSFTKTSSTSSIVAQWKMAGFSIPRAIIVQTFEAHPRQTAENTVDFQARTWHIISADDQNL